MTRLATLALIVSLAGGCVLDEEYGSETEALAAAFSSFDAAQAGWDDVNGGSIVRVFWTGPHCDTTCTFEVDGGSGWQELRPDQFSFLGSQIIETSGLQYGGTYKFRATTAPIPGRTSDTGNGTATTTPGYPGITSPEAQITAVQRKSNIEVAVLNSGLALSPFFNDVDRVTGQFIPRVLRRSPVSYAFFDGDGDGDVLMSPMPGSFTSIKDAAGNLFDYRNTRVFGPLQSLTFNISDPRLPAVYDWQPLHSNRLASDGRQANLVIVARFDSWPSIDRSQFVAVHVAIDKQTGAHIGDAVVMLAGDLDRNDRADHRVVLASEPGEPPVITRWDWQAPQGNALPRVTGEVVGAVEFEDPNGVLDYRATVAFSFDIDVNTYW